MPFREVPHTADWALQVWASDLPGLFREAALGMNALAGMQLSEGPRLSRSFHTESPDAESLLVVFLTELIYYAEQEHLGFDQFAIRFEETPNVMRFQVEMSGAPLERINKVIKAVTYHNLAIRSSEDGLNVTIVFDV